MMIASDDRALIFSRLKKANQGRIKLPHPSQTAAPKKALLKGEAMIDRFIQAASGQYATVSHLKTFKELPHFMASWLHGHNLPKDFMIAPILGDLPWQDEPLIFPKSGAATTDDLIGLNLAYGASAETGTVMMISGGDTPTTLNFVPDVNIIALSKKDMSAGLEGCWEKLRHWNAKNPMPRAVNFITGPSRTGDVEGTLVLGAHGPRMLHIVLIDEESPWQKID